MEITFNVRCVQVKTVHRCRSKRGPMFPLLKNAKMSMISNLISNASFDKGSGLKF